MMNVRGKCHPDFETVAAAFEANFRDRAELGASVCVYKEGEKVVDLWGGWFDVAATRPWEADTVCPVFSTTKGFTATAVARCVDLGLIDYTAPVAAYWPEFAANGKAAITVDHVMSHSAGLNALKKPFTYDDLYDWKKVVTALAEQDVWWEPGSRSAYHSTTYGWLAGELVRRTTGKKPSELFAEEIAAPLGLVNQIGIRLTEAERGRAAEVAAPRTPMPAPADLSRIPPDVIATFMNPAFEMSMANDFRWRSGELPHGAGFGNARSVATLYAALGQGGRLNGARILEPETVARAIAPRIRNVDRVFGFELSWAAGFIVAPSRFPYGPGLRTFGGTGFGGSYGFADPDHGVAFAYVMNQLENDLTGDPRGRSMVDALYRAIRRH